MKPVLKHKGFTVPRMVKREASALDGGAEARSAGTAGQATSSIGDVQPSAEQPLPPKRFKAPVTTAEKENAVPASALQQKPRIPLPAVRLPAKPASAAPAAAVSNADRYMAVLYTKREKFKKKSQRNWQDGILQLNPGGAYCLFDMEGKQVTKHKTKVPSNLEVGATLELGTFVAEVDRDIAEEDFRRGTCFSSCSAAAAAGPSSCGLAWMPPTKPNGSGAFSAPTRGGAAAAAAGQAGTSTAAAAPPPAPLFDPSDPEAIVLNAAEWKSGAGKLPGGRPVVPVCVDPWLRRHLRPHQREGVQFMYECCMGLRAPGRHGCILADEMGLGKTLQTITLLWSLMRQGPEGRPVVRKAIVVAPATLVQNWGKEVKKWLGTERLRVMVLSQGGAAQEQVRDFRLGSVWKLLVGSYETVRKYAADLEGQCDLLVCDEGHRLKAAAGNKTISALNHLGCSRRVVLTGTPVQNDLQEFYALLSFATPDLLGPPVSFKRVYGDPIARSRDRDATQRDKELGEARAQELQEKVSAYVLRRTQDILSKHLPPLSTFTLFCAPTELQVALYRSVLKSKSITTLLHGGSGAQEEGVLPAITVLKKLCNHPDLLAAVDGKSQQGVAAAAAAALAVHVEMRQVPDEANCIGHSGKLRVLESLLTSILASGNRAVLVSTSTSTLDLIDRMLCQPNGISTVRIDGGTNVEERQTRVDNFNNLNMGQVFLLSTRAGGAGLNLIGANSLVLFDSDWNPAMDKQAMARIWRDGQTKPCFVYRLLTTGTLEEKVYQRQLMKSDLAAATMDAGPGARSLPHDELKQLFSLEVKASGCATRDLLACGSSAAAAAAASGMKWLDLADAGALPVALAAAVAAGGITCANQERAPSAVPVDEAASDADEGGDEAAGGSADGGYDTVDDPDCLEMMD